MTGVPPPLPEPGRKRWQPLRLGLVELYYYDSEEFWFRDGHLLLRGNNGTGKSKVLSLSLPFLFDASLRSDRVEPDGDRGKRMEWNLLMGGAGGERRTGYTWIEFGRVDEQGNARFLTLGCGLKAVAGKPVEPWYFITGLRVGAELWLTTADRHALSRDRLETALGAQGQVYENAQTYRRAVDERLFQLGETRYAALIDTLIQLRQPQLSKQPDEQRLSAALSEALPPLDRALLEDVAEAFNRLDDLKRELEELEAMCKAVAAFDRRYRLYAQVAARRRAAGVRAAQTEHDKASQALNRDGADLLAAEAQVSLLRERAGVLELQLIDDRARLQALGEDPAHLDAQRLDEAGQIAERSVGLAQAASRRAEQALRQHGEEQASSAARDRQRLASRRRLLDELTPAAELADATGLGAGHADLLLGAELPDGVAALSAERPEHLRRQAEAMAQERLRQIVLLRKRLQDLQEALRQRDAALAARKDCAEAFEAAGTTVQERQRELRRAEQDLAQAWTQFLAGLEALRIEADDAVDAGLEAFERWLETGDGRNPLRGIVEQAYQRAVQLLAEQRALLQQMRTVLELEQAELADERATLLRGDDRRPPVALYRDPEIRRHRAGAPLWQLVDFRPDCSVETRAGLEAALQASGLLDAWLSPAGELLDPWRQDVCLLARPVGVAEPLSRFLQVSLPERECGLDADTVRAVLGGIAVAEQDPVQAEAWVSPQGGFRLGPATGAWTKPQAEFIGHAARESARQRRLGEIEQRLAELTTQAESQRQQLTELEQRAQRQRLELAAVPSEESLLRAQSAFAEAERQRRLAQERLAAAEARLAAAQSAADRARDALEIDAADLRLPMDGSALDTLGSAVQEYRQAATRLAAALREHRRDALELAEQTQRELAAREASERAEQENRESQAAAQQARTRYETLRSTVGERVDALQARLAEAAAVLKQHEGEREQLIKDQIETSGRHSAAVQKQQQTQERLELRASERRLAVAVLQDFAATGLLRQALPELETPPGEAPWGIDAALTLARRSEALLVEIAAEDADWQRVQSGIGNDLNELQRAMSAQGHEAVMEVANDCMRVQIVYHQRAHAPDRLRELVERERDERRQQLSAREREILENYLQQEIASELQRLVQDTERRVTAINAELERRPTSTGVRFRLEWQADPAAAPAGLPEARARLLRTRAEAWSPEDRRVIGGFLAQRIEAERQRDELAVQLDVLVRALDYRRWHRFAVQRKTSRTDTQWKPLSGPASSGEKALGLTVPLFAAASSFYASADPCAPRLVLLDEAFAGIDDDARRHCMALVHEFDLDFLMTSEREWACYAELPGVAISQLVRREGADAVFVSRWTWDGLEKRPQADPDRRTPTPLS
jgi:uncharacterized protein (TIGR02680 family)